MVSQEIINIIIRAQDQASAALQKFNNTLKKVGTNSKSSMDQASNSFMNYQQKISETTGKLNKTSQTINKIGTNGVNSFNQLSQAQQKSLLHFSTLDKKSQDIVQTLDRVGITGISSFQQLSQGQQKALTNMNSLSQSVNKGITNLSQFNVNATAVQQKLATMKIDPSLNSELEAAKVKISGMGVDLDSTKGKIMLLGVEIQNSLTSKWDNVKNKVSTTASFISTKLSSALSTVRSKIDSVANAFSGMGGIISSAIGGLGMSSISQLTIGLAMTREQMTNLTSATMGSASAAKSFVGYLDKMTNNSLVSLNDLGQAMNTIKMSTGMTNDQLKGFSTTVNDIGQRAILMGKNGDEAMAIMQAAGRGLNGEFDILKTNFGITKETLTNLGWSGAASDVEGYQKALDKALAAGGDMDGMMNTTTGLLKQVEKGFTSAGRKIGEKFTPFIRMGLQWMVQMKSHCPGLYSGLILIAGAMSGFATIAPALAPMLTAFDSLAGKTKTLLTFIGLLEAEEGALTMSTLSSAIATKADAIAKAFGASAAQLATAANGGLTASLWAMTVAIVTNPITWFVVALIALAVAIYEVGKAFGWWTDVGSMLQAIWAGLQRLWAAFINHPDVQAFLKGVSEAWSALMSALKPVFSFLGEIWNQICPPGMKGKVDAVRVIIDAFGLAWSFIKAPIMGAVLAIQGVIWVLQALWSVAAPIGQAIYNALKPIVCILLGCSPGIVPALKSVYEWFTSVWNAIAGFIGGVVSGIVGTLGTIINSLGSLINYIISGQASLDMVNFVFGGLYNILNLIGSFIPGVFQPAWQLMMDIFMVVWNSVTQLVNIFIELMNGQITLGQAITMVWNLIWSTLSTIFSMIITTVWGWANQMWASAISAASGFVNNVISFISSLPGRIWAWLWNSIMRVVSWASSMYSHARSAGSRFVTGAISFISTLPGRIWAYLSSAIHHAVSWASSMIAQARHTGSGMVTGLISYLKSLPGKAYTEFMNMKNRILSAGAQIIAQARNIGSNIVKAMLNAMGIHSPGKIQIAVVGEFYNMIKKIRTMVSPASQAAKTLGESIVNGFGNPQLESNISTTQTVTTAYDNKDFTNDVNSIGYGNNDTDTNIFTELQNFLKNLKEENSNDSSDPVEVDINLKVEHDFDLSELPEGVSEDNVIEILKEIVTNENWIKKLVNNHVFQDTDYKIKQVIQQRNNRGAGI